MTDAYLEGHPASYAEWSRGTCYSIIGYLFIQYD
jgi:hypothetical protein